MKPDWTSHLVEPKTILGPYGGEAPPLAEFAPHAWRAQFNQVFVAGQFVHLPANVPSSWGTAQDARAYAVFHFLDVRLLQVEGVPQRSPEDDEMHGQPGGCTGECSLAALSDLFINDLESGIVVPWKRFSFRQPAASILVEAAHVTLTCGRRADGQFGRSYA